MEEEAKEAPVVLVVDDHQDSRAVLRRLLESNGLRVVEAADGEQALRGARRHRPDLILMDIQMPRLGGVEATRRIRWSEGACAGVPVVALTAFDGGGTREAAEEAGCDAYLTKPVDLAELNRLLRRFIPGFGTSAPGRAVPAAAEIDSVGPRQSRRQ